MKLKEKNVRLNMKINNVKRQNEKILNEKKIVNKSFNSNTKRK